MNKKAFTLIELLAVITILAIIALIAVPNVTNLIKNSNNTAKENQEKLIIKAAQNWANATGLNLCDATESNKNRNCCCNGISNEEKIFCITKKASVTRTTQALVEDGYLDDISTDYASTCVVITKNNNKNQYTLKKSGCAPDETTTSYCS